jgi:hypothetical protein
MLALVAFFRLHKDCLAGKIFMRFLESLKSCLDHLNVGNGENANVGKKEWNSQCLFWIPQLHFSFSDRCSSL